MGHKTQIKVRGYHLDVYQHVNNARYLEFLEEARWAYMDKFGDIQYSHSLGLAWVIVNININYRAPATIEQILEIETCLSRLGNKSAVFHQTITLQGTQTVIADADITFVVLEQKTGKPVVIEGSLRERMESYLT